MFYFKIGRLDTMKDDYLPERDPWFRRVSLSLRQTVQWGIRICAVFPSVGGSEGGLEGTAINLLARPIV